MASRSNLERPCVVRSSSRERRRRTRGRAWTSCFAQTKRQKRAEIPIQAQTPRPTIEVLRRNSSPLQDKRLKPSVGLEPTTPSLPSTTEGAMGSLESAFCGVFGAGEDPGDWLFGADPAQNRPKIGLLADRGVAERHDREDAPEPSRVGAHTPAAQPRAYPREPRPSGAGPDAPRARYCCRPERRPGRGQRTLLQRPGRCRTTASGRAGASVRNWRARGVR
jgi:hypothetical protein